MAVCTFFGHRNTPESIEPILKSVLVDLIENENVDLFYVGNHGKFDTLVRKNLKLLQRNYPYIRYFVVLSSLPGSKKSDDHDYSDTIIPEGFESVHPKYSVIHRNQWMINQADIIISYVNHTYGGAYNSLEYARRKKKIIINLAEHENL